MGGGSQLPSEEPPERLFVAGALEEGDAVPVAPAEVDVGNASSGVVGVGVESTGLSVAVVSSAIASSITSSTCRLTFDAGAVKVSSGRMTTLS
jgi:hypothetical protein